VDDPVCGDALRASGTMDRTGPGNKPRGLGNPQETVDVSINGILRDYTGRDCDVQDIVQPATPALTGGQGNLMLEAKQRAAGSSPAGGISTNIRRH
jgi:hypothetical protein